MFYAEEEQAIHSITVHDVLVGVRGADHDDLQKQIFSWRDVAYFHKAKFRRFQRKHWGVRSTEEAAASLKGRPGKLWRVN
ncbi:dual oxidase 1-like isoform X1 [Arapaima gigas]